MTKIKTETVRHIETHRLILGDRKRDKEKIYEQNETKRQ